MCSRADGCVAGACRALLQYSTTRDTRKVQQLQAKYKGLKPFCNRYCKTGDGRAFLDEEDGRFYLAAFVGSASEMFSSYERIVNVSGRCVTCLPSG